MKSVADAVSTYYISYHYFKISKICQKCVRPSNQAQAVMLIYYRRVPHKNDEIITEGSDAFITYHISYHYFKTSKIPQKFKTGPIIKESISKTYDIILDACMKYEN